MKTVLKDVLCFTLFKVIKTTLNNIVDPESGVKMLNNYLLLFNTAFISASCSFFCRVGRLCFPRSVTYEAINVSNI